MRRVIVGLVAALALSSCASIGSGDRQPLPTKIADRVFEVSEAHRPLRVCLMAASVVEIMTDRVQTFDGNQAPAALGRLMALQGSIDAARTANPLWTNTDMADVSYQFAVVLREAGQEKFSRILFGGPTVANFVDVVRRAALVGLKGEALLLDINSMLTRVDDGSLTEAEAWAACDQRMSKNRTTLLALSGVGG